MAVGPRSWYLAVVVVVAIAAGCSVSRVDALQIPKGQSAEVCTPSNGQGQATLGIDFLTNTAPDEVRVLRVELVEAENLRVGRWALEDTELPGGQNGAALGWATVSGNWGHDPIPPEETVHLVLGLQVEDTAAVSLASAQAAKVAYRLPDGSEGEATGAFAVEVSPNPDVPCF
jgi:hypothetical protein